MLRPWLACCVRPLLVAALLLLTASQVTAQKPTPSEPDYSWVCKWPSRVNQKIPYSAVKGALLQVGRKQVESWARPRRPGGSWRLPTKDELPQEIKARAVQLHGRKAVALRHDVINTMNKRYRVKVPWAKQNTGDRDQRSSGRCWIFAGNVALESVALKRNNKQTRLSESFVNYHALRRAAFGVLDQAGKSQKKPLPPKTAQKISEGGFAAWYYDIVRLDGIVPESAFPSTWPANRSSDYLGAVRSVVSDALRKIEHVGLGKDTREQRQAIIKQAKADVISQLNLALGEPPKRFSIDGKRYSPRTFTKKYLGLTDSDLDVVILGNDPSSAFNRHSTVKGFPGMKPFKQHNVGISTLRDVARKALRKGNALYFSTNISSSNPHVVGKTPHVPAKAKGVLNINAFDYTQLMPKGWKRMSKRDRRKVAELNANHAMALVGYDTSKTPKWLVQNSYGTSHGDKGRLHMYDDFFTYYASTVAVPRAMVSTKVLKKSLERAPVKRDHGHAVDL